MVEASGMWGLMIWLINFVDIKGLSHQNVDEQKTQEVEAAQRYANISINRIMGMDNQSIRFVPVVIPASLQR